MKPMFFKTPREFRAWLERHHRSACELIVGFYKKGSGQPGITWSESVDEALCFGWIDGIRGIRSRVDDVSYSIRFTPRRPQSIWSTVNTKRVALLVRENRMRPAGIKAFQARDPEKTGIYSFERESAALPASYARVFRANSRAWSYFDAQPAGYKRLAIHWVTSAKQEQTRKRRLDLLIRDSETCQRLKHYDIANRTRD